MSEHCISDSCPKCGPSVLDRILDDAQRPSVGRSGGERRQHQLAMRHLLKTSVPQAAAELDDAGDVYAVEQRAAHEQE